MNKASRKKVLLIEDEAFIRELYERVLSQAGFDVASAADGVQGLVSAYKKPHLILLDIMMPYLNGIELLKKLKKNDKTKSIPVILLTNLGQESIIKEALQHGACGYLMKMRLSPYDLVDRVREFLAHPDRRIDYRSLGLFD